MGYGRPSKYGYASTPSPGGATVVTPDEWTDVPLGLSNWHISARDGATEINKWDITNPTASSMRIVRNTQQVANWNPGGYAGGAFSGGDHDQKAPCILFKTQMDPRPDAAHALPGITDNRWRHGECQLTVAMRVSEPFHTTNAGENGFTIGCGVGFLFSKSDLGSGAALVAAAPTPPFMGNQTPGGGDQFHYFGTWVSKADHATDVNWNRAQKGRGDDNLGVDWWDAHTTSSVFGATGQVDTAVVQLPHHPNESDSNKGLVRFWYEDSRVNRAPVNGYYGGGIRVDSLKQWQTYKLGTEGTYVYIALFPTVWGSAASVVGSGLDILEVKYNLSHIKVGA